jgi:hypothetical protein
MTEVKVADLINDIICPESHPFHGVIRILPWQPSTVVLGDGTIRPELFTVLGPYNPEEKPSLRWERQTLPVNVFYSAELEKLTGRFANVQDQETKSAWVIIKQVRRLQFSSSFSSNISLY